MTQNQVYPLAQVLEVKIKREETAQKVVDEKKHLLEKEQEALEKAKKARDLVKEHYQEKLRQLRETLDQETDTPTIERMKYYLKIVQTNLAQEEAKVTEQKKRTDAAERALEEAKNIWREKRKEVDKLQEHRLQWQKENARQESINLEKQMDEIGTVIYYAKNREAK